MSEIWIAGLAAAAVVGAGTYGAAKSQKGPGQAGSINVGQASADALQANNQNTPEIEALLRRANSFTQDQNISLLNRAVPGYDQIAQNLSNQALQASQNPYALPTEFSDNLTRIAAERGINTGVKGQAGDYSLLRDFGVNSLQYGQQQLANSQSILSTLAGLAKVNPLSPLSMYVTPQNALTAQAQQLSADQAYLNAQQAAANQRNAAPWTALASAGGTFAGIYGMGGGGAGKTGGGDNGLGGFYGGGTGGYDSSGVYTLPTYTVTGK